MHIKDIILRSIMCTTNQRPCRVSRPHDLSLAHISCCRRAFLSARPEWKGIETWLRGFSKNQTIQTTRIRTWSVLIVFPASLSSISRSPLHLLTFGFILSTHPYLSIDPRPLTVSRRPSKCRRRVPCMRASVYPRIAGPSRTNPQPCGQCYCPLV